MQVPADASLLPAVRAAVAAIAQRMEVGAAGIGAVRRAAEELATTLVRAARPWTLLDIEVVQDDEDVYLRMAVERRSVDRPHRTAGLTRLLLAGTIHSVDVGVEGSRLYGVVQHARG